MQVLLQLVDTSRERNEHGRVCVQADHTAEPVKSVRLMEDGIAALEAIDDELGLAFDDWDKDYYYKLFACALSASDVQCCASCFWCLGFLVCCLSWCS